MTVGELQVGRLAQASRPQPDPLDARLAANWASAAKSDRFWRAFMPLLFAGLVLTAWQLSSTQGIFVIPSVPAFLAATGRQLADPQFWGAIATSETALLVGFLAAVAVGVPLGLAAGRARAIEDVIDPYVSITIITPMAMVLPIVLMIFGLTFTARAVVVFIFSFPFVLVPVRAAVLTIPPELWEMCHCYGASELQLWRELLIPGTLPAMVSGFRQGLAHGFSGMILVELLLLAVGVGQLLLRFQSKFDYASIFAVVFLLVCESWLLLGALTFLERRARGAHGDSVAVNIFKENF